MMQSRLIAINLVSYMSLIIVNILAIQIPFFGKTPGDVSDLFPNLLTPADFTFRIWSIIYLLLGIFIFYQTKFFVRQKHTIPSEVSAIGLLFFLSCLLNFCWLAAWQSLNIGWAFAFILMLWLALILIYYRLTQLEKPKWVYTVPFSFYLAWVCIAALANLNVLLIDSGFDFFGLSEEYWTTALIATGIGGTLLVLYLNKDIWFTMVIIWAFFGVFIKNKQLSTEGSWVINMSVIAMITLCIVGLWVGSRKNTFLIKNDEII